MKFREPVTNVWDLPQDGDALRFPRLTEDVEVDVCVIGAGITGLTTAYLLAREGLSVRVLDQGRICSGESGRTTGHLTHVFDTYPDELIQSFDRDTAKNIWDGLALGINLIEQIAETERISCDFARIPGYLCAENDEQVARLQLVADAVRDIGHPFTTDGTSLHFQPLSLLKFQNQARFHPRKYLQGLAAKLKSMGVSIFEDTSVEDVSAALPHKIDTAHGPIVTAQQVVIAAHVPFNNRFALHTKQAAYRTYVVGFQVPKGTFPDVLLWDMDEPYHYTRLYPGENQQFDIVIVGGEDHKTGHGPEGDPFDRLAKFARQRYAIAGEPVYRWSGQIMEPADGLPFIGDNPGTRTEQVATGFSGDGLTIGTLAAHIMSERILGRTTIWDAILSPGRLAVHGLKDYLIENVDFPVCLVGDKISPSYEERALGTLHVGEGGIFNIGGHSVAVSRLNDGHLAAVSPTCTHLGCSVRWNVLESSWDCPCHGSRFAPTGEVINGPAFKALTEVSLIEALADEEARRTVPQALPTAEDWVAT